jgi:site-specific recombinase XerD
MATLDEEVLASFERHLTKCRCSSPRGAPRIVAMAGARHFLRHLRRLGVARRPPLAEVVEAPFAIARYRVGEVGKHVDGFAQFLIQQGYAHETTMMYLSAVRHLGHWMTLERVAVDQLDDKALDAFEEHLARCRCPRSRRGRWSGALPGARRFLAFLRREGIAAQPRAEVAPRIITDYCDWMAAHRGVGNATLIHHRRYLRRFLAFAGEDPGQLTPRLVRRFLVLVPHAKKATFGAVRMFLRFLAATGRSASGLEAAVPAIAQWRLSSLPRYLPAEDVERVVATAPHGSRERAVLLLLARLGLRRGDVVALRLGDLDWKQGTIRVAGKSGRESRLPLPQEVGGAILAYLRHRPVADTDRVFVTTQAPMQPVTASAVSGIVYWAILRAGIRVPSRGCHLLRHTAAVGWLRAGLSMEAIGSLLRHRHLETTEIYAKVDVAALREIARPWPGSAR